MKALGEAFLSCGLTKSDEDFRVESAGSGVGEDLGSAEGFGEGSDLRWKKPRMDFWPEAGACFLALAEGFGVDIVGRQLGRATVGGGGEATLATGYLSCDATGVRVKAGVRVASRQGPSF